MNKWFNNQSITPMEFILDTDIEGTRVVDLTDEQALIIKSILEQKFSIDHHRCISVYRDTIVIDDVIYNLCLSCGDVIINNEVFYLTSFQEESLIQLKKKFF